MTFQTFLAKRKNMFNVFEEVGEPKPESAKIRFLLDGVRTELQPTAANMIASQVTPKETSRSVSGLGKESGGQDIGGSYSRSSQGPRQTSQGLSAEVEARRLAEEEADILPGDFPKKLHVEAREVFPLKRQDSDRTQVVDESLTSGVEANRCGASSFQPNSETDQPPQSYSSLLELQEVDEEIDHGILHLLELVVRKRLGESLTSAELEVPDNFEALSQAGQGDIKHTGRPRRTSIIVTCCIYRLLLTDHIVVSTSLY
jgi:hypothetical protein